MILKAQSFSCLNLTRRLKIRTKFNCYLSQEQHSRNAYSCTCRTLPTRQTLTYMCMHSPPRILPAPENNTVSTEIRICAFPSFTNTCTCDMYITHAVSFTAPLLRSGRLSSQGFLVFSKQIRNNTAILQFWFNIPMKYSI